jgi:hypothetical protein
VSGKGWIETSVYGLIVSTKLLILKSKQPRRISSLLTTATDHVFDHHHENPAAKPKIAKRCFFS